MKAETYGSEPYSEQELIAQIRACFLSAHKSCSMRHFENDAAYIASWLKRLNYDKRFILFASAKAQRAVDYFQCAILTNSGRFGNGKYSK